MWLLLLLKPPRLLLLPLTQLLRQLPPLLTQLLRLPLLALLTLLPLLAPSLLTPSTRLPMQPRTLSRSNRLIPVTAKTARCEPGGFFTPTCWQCSLLELEPGATGGLVGNLHFIWFAAQNLSQGGGGKCRRVIAFAQMGGDHILQARVLTKRQQLAGTGI